MALMQNNIKPGIVQRAAAAWRFFNHGLAIEQKQVPFAWPSHIDGKAQWQIYDFQSYVNEGFNLNAIIYEAIMYKVRAMADVRLRGYQGTVEQPILLGDDHPYTQLLNRPNPYQSQNEFMGQHITFLNLTGNSYIFFDRPKIGAFPTAMYSMRPDRVFIVPKARGIAGYKYVAEGRSIADAIPLLAEDVMHVKLPNPGDPLEGLGYGLSPLSAIARSADVDNDVTQFLKMFFQSGANTSSFLQFEDYLTNEQIAEVKRRWREIYGGFENWGDVGVLDKGATLNKTGQTFQEMGFGTLDERNESRIAGPFGVPLILIGARLGLMRSTYSNYEEARKAFWEDTMRFEIKLFEDDFIHFLTDGDLFPKFDLSEVPALQKNMPDLVTMALKIADRGIALNDALAFVGLSMRLPGGDIPYLATNLKPLSAVPTEPPAIALPMPTVPPAPPDDEKPKPEKDAAEQSKTLPFVSRAPFGQTMIVNN